MHTGTHIHTHGFSHVYKRSLLSEYKLSASLHICELTGQKKTIDLIIVLTYNGIYKEIFVQLCCSPIPSLDGGNWIPCSQLNDDCEPSY